MAISAPAFRFYPADFLVGTARMTAEQIGGYILLLCEQWDKGFLPNNDAELLEISRLKEKSLAAVKRKFFLCDDGSLRNKRLEEERDKQLNYREKQSLNGSKGGRPPKQKKDEEKPNPNPTLTQAEAKKSLSLSLLLSLSETTQTQRADAQDFSSIDLEDGLPAITLSPNRPADAPTITEVGWYFHNYLKQPLRLRKFFTHYETSGWLDKYGKSIIPHWQSKASQWVSNDIEREQREAVKAEEKLRLQEEKRLAKAAPKQPPKPIGLTAADIIKRRQAQNPSNP